MLIPVYYLMACYEFMGMMISKMVYKEGIKAI